ncbi:tetratricopeptide repeat protein [Solihabitans fulvus]|uniref:Tetratricopeptide repeat protein n=1 Tax=Solihabitans fulvus TaxID=1892852 RepID=A0A5B2XLC0_9PSEU|nr:tetratricopeptide repeat protein [Solihabitans fulvus]
MAGPVEAWGTGGQARLPGSKQLALLTALLLHANRVVPVEQLSEALWGDDPPVNAGKALQTYVFRLRRTLAAVEPGADQRLAFTAGYRLRIEPGELDLAVFREQVGHARAAANAGRPQAAAEMFASALELWRGRALIGVSGSYFGAHAARLEEERLAALEERIDADLAAGRDAELVAELQNLADEHPVRERLHGHLMRALYRAGRQAEALRTFHELHDHLADELGIEPGSEITELHQRILRGDPDLAGSRPSVETRPPVEKQAARNDLPGDIGDFTGRDTEMARLLAALPDDGDGSTVVIEAIDGMAGVGKTTLAVHAAHQLTNQYPDAQLFIDLHGHTTEHEAIDPFTALGVLLRALGVSSDQLPHELDQRAALWRAELADRKALVVLDNAASAAQVRPLLPGAASCLALITSRRRLADLDTARTLSLDVLPPQDAIALFSRIAGADRAATEPEAVAEVVELCGFLPLAIRIAAARLHTRPAWTVTYLADRLSSGRGKLAELATGDRSVAAAFTLSYQDLAPDQQRMFRLLGLHPGPSFDAHSAASLAGIGVDQAGSILEGLVDVHLLNQPAPDRYRFHDLLRHHANTTVLAEEHDASRQQALRRLLDFYLHSAVTGDRLLHPQRPPIVLDPPVPGCHLAPMTEGPVALLAWFDVEHHCLLAAQQTALIQGWYAVAWQFAWTLGAYHQRRGHVHDDLAAWQVGLAAAIQLGDPAIRSTAHRFLGWAYARVGRHIEAQEHLQQALALAESTGDQPSQAHCHQALALALGHQGQHQRALEHATHALHLYRALGAAAWEADALNRVGWFVAQLGRYDQARAPLEEAVILHRRHHNRDGEASTLDSLGFVARRSGQHAQAVDYYQQALALRRNLGATYEVANTLDALGHPHAALGQLDEARAAWQEALQLYRAQRRTADADRVQQQLDALNQPAT